MSEITNSRRSCGDCNACCRGCFTLDTDEIKVPFGTVCPHLTDTGCGIYTTRPTDPCRKFFCGWASTDSPLPDWMQPHKSKAIVLFNAIHWQNMTLDKVVPVNQQIPKETIKWLKEFFRAHNRPAVFIQNALLINGNGSGSSKFFVYAPESLKKKIDTWCAAGNKLV